MKSFTHSIAGLVEAAIRPALARICYGRTIPRGLEEWKRVAFSWSQFGEDLIAAGIFNARGLSRTSMFYVDVGAYHPFQYSNTLLFQKRGWNGINVDANPDTIALFDRYRPGDQNIHCAVGPSQSEARFHMYSSVGVCPTGRLSDKGASPLSILGEKTERTIAVQVRRLDSILEESELRGKQFGLLNVDVEGHEMGVLQSNCWVRFRPVVVAVEDHPNSESVFETFFEEKGYTLAGQCSITKLFVDTRKPLR